MLNVIVSVCLCLGATQGVTVVQEQLSPQEAFFLKRMTEFWKDRDFQLVKLQVTEFLEGHPDSSIRDQLQAILADILYQEKSYDTALALYEKIGNTGLQNKTLPRKCQCLYLLGNYDSVIHLLTPIISEQKSEEMEFILADSLFRKLRTLSHGDEQDRMALQAKPLLLALCDTPYREKVLMPLAEIHRMMGESEKAATLYLELADKMVEKKEEILFQAAVLQMEFNKGAAIDTFRQVVNLGQHKAADAAYNELVLLFQENRFFDLIARAESIGGKLTGEAKTYFHFCLARSHFKLEQFEEAVAPFNQFIHDEREATPYKRAAYLTLIACAQKLSNNTLFDTTLAGFLVDFPLDDESGNALLLHAQVAMQNGNTAQAIHDLQHLLTSFPTIGERETLLYDLALLQSKNREWSQSRQTFLTYLNDYPNTPHSSAWASIVYCSVEELKEATPETLNIKKGQLVSDLQRALEKPNLFSADETPQYLFLLGQLQFDLENYRDAVATLTAFADQFPDHALVPEAVVLQAHLHRQLQSPPELFVKVAERALTLTNDPDRKKALSSQLFNAYLTLKEYDLAASHLYNTVVVEHGSVQPENELWLTHYYFGQAKAGNRESELKAVQLFQKILNSDDTMSLHFDPQKTYLESEVLKYGELLPLPAKKQLLLSLVEIQNRHPDMPWKLHRQALFELGKISLTQNDEEGALKMFDILIASSSLTPSYYSNAALLEKSRIELSHCTDRTESNPTICSVLSTLKDLQIQKKLVCEPLHLEAALEYADIRTALAPQESKTESAIFFLTRVKDDFAAQDDPIGQEYHEARIRYPEKDTLYRNYMKCIESEILRLEAEQAVVQNNLEKANRSREVALALLREVLDDEAITPYLRNRAEHNLKLLIE